MNPNEAMVAIVALVGVCGAPVLGLYLWLRRPGAGAKLPARADIAALESRLERIEVAVQSIAVETERISEGQRFATRLLAASEKSQQDRSTVPRG